LLGLEDEPVCRTPFAFDEDEHAPGLVAVSVGEWEAARTTGWWSSLAGYRGVICPVLELGQRLAAE